ncbi:hypothetical protein [Nocardia sp. NPDC006630]|uniref:TY-Chap domain-containing protein n=1 Tax=Nocardia sp. NPDC006630 TaxID=3157181 RepID=UPI0033A70F75
MTTWDEFTDGLAEELATLPAGALVTIDTDAPDTQAGFAQFAQTQDKLHAELGAYADLDPAAGPDAPGNRLVLGAGWHAPGGDNDINWWFELPWPVRSAIYRELAAMVVVGLRDAFHVLGPDRLVYQAWNSSANNQPLDLPLLGIAKQ